VLPAPLRVTTGRPSLAQLYDGYSAAFIAQYSESPFFKKEVELNSLQSAIPKKINLRSISEVRVEIPADLNEQNAIAAVLSDMDADNREVIQTG